MARQPIVIFMTEVIIILQFYIKFYKLTYEQKVVHTNRIEGAVKIDESSGKRCILIWLPDHPLSLPLTHQLSEIIFEYVWI